VGIVPTVAAGALDVSGQPNAAALREGSYRDPALSEEGKHRREPPSPPPGTSSGRNRSQHPG